MSRLNARLSYANVVSTLCLLLVLGAGGAHAAGLAKNSVKSSHIKDGHVKTADLAGGAVKSQAVAPDSLTGADIMESSLSGVDAGKVGGLTVKKIRWRVPPNTASTSILTYVGKFRIDASCSGTSAIDIAAFTAEDGSAITGFANVAGNADDSDGIRDIASVVDFEFDTTEGFAIDDMVAAVVTKHVVLDFATPSGFVVRADLFVTNPSGDGCQITGIGIGG